MQCSSTRLGCRSSSLQGRRLGNVRDRQGSGRKYALRRYSTPVAAADVSTGVSDVEKRGMTVVLSFDCCLERDVIYCKKKKSKDNRKIGLIQNSEKEREKRERERSSFLLNFTLSLSLP